MEKPFLIRTFVGRIFALAVHCILLLFILSFYLSLRCHPGCAPANSKVWG